MTDPAAFRLSRVYADGWNAANKLAAHEVDELNPDKIAALNPYAIDADRSRWMAGFTKALATERPLTRRALPL